MPVTQGYELESYRCPACDDPGAAGELCPKHDLYFSCPSAVGRKPAPRLLGHLIADKYAILGLLGQGGMAHVYWGIELGTGQRVALKVMKDNLTESLSSEQRFMREAAIITQINNPRLIQCFEAGVHDHVAFMAMEVLEGISLSLFFRHGMRTVPAMSAIAVQLLEGVAAIHASGLVHRDLKPGNIMLCAVGDGQACIKIIDFGLARRLESEGPTLTGGDDVLGTARYMSPDIVKGSRFAGPPTDIYGLGVILYEMLCGHTPFDGSNSFELVRKHVQDPVPPLRDKVDPEVPDGLLDFVYRCLEKNPDDRFADGNAALAAFWKLELEDEGPIWLTEPASGHEESFGPASVTIALSDEDLDFGEIPPEKSIILRRPPPLT